MLELWGNDPLGPPGYDYARTPSVFSMGRVVLVFEITTFLSTFKLFSMVKWF